MEANAIAKNLLLNQICNNCYSCDKVNTTESILRRNMCWSANKIGAGHGWKELSKDGTCEDWRES